LTFTAETRRHGGFGISRNGPPATWDRAWRATPLLLFLLAGLFGVACGDGSDTRTITDVTIEPLASATQRTAMMATSKGGQPADTPTSVPDTTDEAASDPTEAPPTAAIATSTPEPPTAASAPSSGRWIDVDVTNFSVRLMDGESAVRAIAPVGVGVAIDTGAYISTQTGLFYVNSKREALVYDAPFDTYISHWVGFDADKDNGFHSFLKDAEGNIVDASTGRVSNGCIRTGEPDVVFAYAEIGMPVFVHW
jgi:L,D-transpeptidase-like protein